MSDGMLELRAITRGFPEGGGRLEVLKGASVTVNAGEIVALTGPSGSGKSTLMHIAGLLERPDGGEVLVGGRPCNGLDDGERTAIRRTRLGFVYQFHHLLPEFSALENVVVPQMIAGVSKSTATEYARDMLERVGLAARADHRPGRLSGGEQQRVAVVRALANEPAILLADEPTGNLDAQTAEAVFSTLEELVREKGLAAVVATHNMDLAARMDRRLTLRDGLIVEG